MIKRYIFTFSIILFSFIEGKTQQPFLKNYTIENGLASSETYTVLQDKKGFIWIATDRGVNRFDGYSFKTFTKQNGLPENTILRVFEDPKGRIWFFGYKGTIAFYKNGKITILPLRKKLLQLIKSGLINSVTYDKNTLWLSFYNTKALIQLSEKNGVFSLKMDKLSFRDGIYIKTLSQKKYIYGWNTEIEGKNSHFHFVKNGHVKTYFKPFKIDYEKFYTRSADNSTDYFLSFCNQIILLNKRTLKLSLKKIDSEILSLKIIENDLYIGTKKRGVLLYKNCQLNSKPINFLNGLSISSIALSTNGSVWFSTLENGIYHTPNKEIKIYNSFSDNKINSITQSNGVTALGLDNGHIVLIKNGNFTELDLNVKKSVLPIEKIQFLSTNELIVLFPTYVKIVNLSTFTIETQLQQPFKTCVLDPTNKSIAWLGGNKRIFKRSNGKLVELPFPKSYKIFSICVLNSNELFLATDDGLIKYNHKNSTFNQSTESILKKPLRQITKTKNTFWIGTKEEGLIIRNSSQIYQLNEKNGLINNYINSIHTLDEKSAWISTDKGISKVEISSWSPFKYQITNFDKSSGFITSEINDIAIENDKLMLASNNGLISMPLSSQKSNDEPQLFIENCSENNKSLILSKSYSFHSDFHDLKFNYVSPNFINPTNQLYRTRLIGLSNSWKETKMLSETYTTLPVGYYIFQVQVLKPNGQWGKAKSIEITVHPNFYETFWFKLLFALLVLIFIIYFYQKRIKTIQQKAEEREALLRKASEMELKFLSAQMNPHFTFNAMNSIQHFILEKEPFVAQQYLAKYAKLIRRVMENNMIASVSIASEIELIKLYVEIESLRFKNKIDLQIICSPELDLSCLIPPLIIQPYIENAIVHGFDNIENKWKILVDLKQVNNVLICTIEDNGIGREKSREKATKEHQSFGMSITQRRIENMPYGLNKGTTEHVDLKDETGKAIGTRVILKIPMKTN